VPTACCASGVGDYRVLYTVDEGKLMVLVLDAGHRSEIYGR
jgi:mRNA interferase RelE/StbE